MARTSGAGLVLVRNANHFGWGPAYAMRHLTAPVAEGLLVGNVTQGAVPIVSPIGGSKPTVGSNAICIALSTCGAEECPYFLWDTVSAEAAVESTNCPAARPCT